MKACVDALAVGGLLVFSIIHPCFEQLGPSWREHGEYRTREYFAEYEIAADAGPGTEAYVHLPNFLVAAARRE